MKFLETLKRYENFVMQENKKLKRAYASLLRESNDFDADLDEDDILRNRPHNRHRMAEAELEPDEYGRAACEADTSFDDAIPENEFIAGANECELDNDEPAISEEDFFEAVDADELNDAENENDDGLTSEADIEMQDAEEFFKTDDKQTADPIADSLENDGVEKTEENDGVEKTELDEDDEITAEEFFREAGNETLDAEESVDKVDANDQTDNDLLSEGDEDVADFFNDKPTESAKSTKFSGEDFLSDSDDEPAPAENDGSSTKAKKKSSKCESKACGKKKTAKVTEKQKKEKPVEDKAEKTEDEELAESLDYYRKMNARLFQA